LKYIKRTVTVIDNV